jgi:hypothetical protein
LACVTQAQASELAQKFNRRLAVSASGRDLQVSFLPCFVYTVIDNNFNYPGGKAKVLVEPLLEGKFQVPPSPSIHHGDRAQRASLTRRNPHARGTACGEQKWNNNAGAVWSRLSTQQDNPAAALSRGMGAIIESDEDDDDDDYSASSQTLKLKPDDVPQAFSHFSFTVTNDIDLCCDLQVRPCRSLGCNYYCN